MTDVEALLSVDAGKVPPGVVAFFMGDADRRTRRVQAVFAATAGIAAVACAYQGGGRLPITLLLLAAAILGVFATPTLRPDGERLIKRQVMVVTANALIVRDARKLRSWRLEDLADVIPGMFEQRPYLDIIERNGNRHTIETIGFRRGERVREIVTKRLRLRQTHPG